MDLTLIILVIVLIISLIFVYIVNNVPKTGNIKRLLNKILRIKPATVSFCLGQRSDNKLFQNVAIDQDGMPNVSFDPFPVNLDGSLIVFGEHGDVVPRGNGYQITGMDLVNFVCPDGYAGPTCVPEPICEAPDVGKIKAITYTQFNALSLYANTFARSPAMSAKTYAMTAEQTHPRISLKCLNEGGDFELHVCPQNSLLDENLECQPYDLCEDHINGYKHNFRISKDEKPLPSNEYYICGNNKSQKTKCAKDTVFSLPSNGCITESECYGKGSITLPIDETKYVQCFNDRGQVIECANGVVEDDMGNLSCKINTCQPRDYRFNNDQLDYVYGRTTCDDDDKPTTIRCDNTSVGRKFKFVWGEEFEYNIDDWPKQILNETSLVCETPDDKIIANAIIQLRYGDAMAQEHPYDLLKRSYVCSDTDKYRWDYETMKLVPPLVDPETELVDSSAPCQPDILRPLPFQFSPKAFRRPSYDVQAPYLYGYINVILPNYDIFSENLHFWPVRNLENNLYYTSYAEYTENKLVMFTYSSTVIPDGFITPFGSDPKNKSKAKKSTKTVLYEFVNLIGLREELARPNRYLYTIATGVLAPIRMFEPELCYKYELPCSQQIDTIGATNFTVNWNLITSDVIVLPDFILRKDKIQIGNALIGVGYIVFAISVVSGFQRVVTTEIVN